MSNNPAIKEAAKNWSKSITQTDKHSQTCRKCSKRKIDEKTAKLTGILGVCVPYGVCRAGQALYLKERQDMAAYRSLGGTLPIWKG